MKAIVHGARGTQGRPTLDIFRTTGLTPVAAVRAPEQAADLTASGIEVRTADLDDRASLERAYAGVDAVILHLPLVFDGDVMARHGENAARAAEAAGVSRFVYNMGVCAPRGETDVPLFAAMQWIEALVLERFERSLVLRPALYLENLLAPWTRAGIEARGEIAYPLPPERPIPWVGLPNVGRLARAALTEDRWPRRTLGARDPEPTTGAKLAELIGAARGAPVRYRELTPEDFGARVGAALGEEASAALTALYQTLNADDGALLRSVDDDACQELDANLEATETWVRRAFTLARGRGA